MRPDLGKGVESSESDLLPEVDHGVRVLDFVPVMQEERNLDLRRELSASCIGRVCPNPAHLPDLLVRGRKVGKHLERTILDGQLGDDVLESALAESRQVQFLRRATQVSLGAAHYPPRSTPTSASL